MRVLVCGSLDSESAANLDLVLDEHHRSTPITSVICGGAGELETRARDWARKNHVGCLTFPARESSQVRAAGPMRNAATLLMGRPDLLIAFDGAKQTANMIEQARKVGIPIVLVPDRQKSALGVRKTERIE